MDISKDIMIMILELLPIQDVMSFLSTCKKYHGLSNNYVLWKKLFKRDYNVKLRSFREDVGYKHAYISLFTSHTEIQESKNYAMKIFVSTGVDFESQHDSGYDVFGDFIDFRWGNEDEYLKLLCDIVFSSPINIPKNTIVIDKDNQMCVFLYKGGRNFAVNKHICLECYEVEIDPNCDFCSDCIEIS